MRGWLIFMRVSGGIVVAFVSGRLICCLGPHFVRYAPKDSLLKALEDRPLHHGCNTCAYERGGVKSERNSSTPAVSSFTWKFDNQ